MLDSATQRLHRRTVGRHALAPVLALITAGCGMVQAAAPTEVSKQIETHLRPHPRLIIDEQSIDRLTKAPADERSAKLRERFFADAKVVLGLPPLERKLQGIRLLFVSRDALHRIATLSLAYRLTGERPYFDAARSNLLTVAKFSDFNPSHFLDVAEMTTALAIGYDWLYADLSEADRAAVRAAIIDKGLTASYTDPPQAFITADFNWNQVCHGGMTMGALAVADDSPKLAADVVTRAVENLPRPMKMYAPDGAYPEGPSYWDYGTTYNTVALAAMQSAVGTDFGLLKQPGFLRTSEYHLHLVGPTGQNLSYSDGNEDAGKTPSPAAYYLARQRGEPWLLFNELKAIDGLLAGPAPIGTANYNPDAWLWLVMLWLPDDAKFVRPPDTHYAAAGHTPVATHRSSWDDDATFVGINGGTPSDGHAHMDIGSFCLDAAGVRWANDLGNQGYTKLESRGIKLWDHKPGSDRWKVFRLGPMSHNILTVNGHEQSVSGRGTIKRSDEYGTVIDLTEMYAADLTNAEREVRILPDRTVLLTDRVRVRPDAAAAVRWAMTTTARVRIDSPQSATLTRDGKTLRVTVESPPDATLSVQSADPPPNDFDARNPGVSQVLIRTTLPPGAAGEVRVLFVPLVAAVGPATAPSGPGPASAPAPTKGSMSTDPAPSGTRLVPIETPIVYADGRPACRWRLDAVDHGPVLRYGGGPGDCDVLGARDVWVWQHAGRYYMHYDAAGPKGWLTSLAVSEDLIHWHKKGPALDFGKPGDEDSASASYGVTYLEGGTWHMFYLGTPHASPAPDNTPSFPYLTMKATAPSPEGPWTKRPAVVPFRTQPGTYRSVTASPGHIVRQGDGYLQFFSATTRIEPEKGQKLGVKRTLGIARTKDLNGPWTCDPKPMLPIEEQVENSSLYFEKSSGTWFLFTNHIGVTNHEYTDAIWVYWSKSLDQWDPQNKAVVLDGRNCTWSRDCVGLPSMVQVGDRLAVFYDAPRDGGIAHMRRDVGLAWLALPLRVP